jgi:hypothetical protein
MRLAVSEIAVMDKNKPAGTENLEESAGGGGGG